MALFNFIETFFFISLAITFVLILMLVYHFKQRIGSLEQKSETMFEIVNNVVKELNNIRNIQQKQSQFSAFPPPPAPPSYGKQPIPQIPKTFSPVKSPLFNEHHITEDSNPSNKIFVSIVEKQENIHVEEIKDVIGTKVIEEADVCEFYDDDEYEDSDDVEEGDDDDIDDDTDIDDETDIDDDNEIIIDYTDMAEVLNQNSDEIQVTAADPESIRVINIDTPVEKTNETETEAEIEQEPDVLHVDKLEDSEIDTTNASQLPLNLNSAQENAKEMYRKMNLNTLKTFVITKGLCTDPSKMKKPDLLKLLETNTVE